MFNPAVWIADVVAGYHCNDKKTFNLTTNNYIMANSVRSLTISHYIVLQQVHLTCQVM